MRVDKDSPSQSIELQNQQVTDSKGKTADNKSVTSIETRKHISKAIGGNSKPSNSLAERSVENNSEIAKPEDFQERVDQIHYLRTIRQRIDTNPAFHALGVEKGADKNTLAGSVRLLVFVAHNSIHRNLIHGIELPGLGTPVSARIYLEDAFGHIKEMQSLDNKLNEFTPVDIALSMAEYKNIAILEPHIKAVFANEENKRKQ